jgi:hypothetical protein
VSDKKEAGSSINAKLLYQEKKGINLALQSNNNYQVNLKGQPNPLHTSPTTK